MRTFAIAYAIGAIIMFCVGVGAVLPLAKQIANQTLTIAQVLEQVQQR